MKRRLLPWLIASLLISPATAGAGDWDSCNEGLQELRSASRRAGFESLKIPHKERQLNNCLALANKYTGYSERCRSLREEYQRQVHKMEDALAEVQSANHRVELACFNAPRIEGSGQRSSIERKLHESRCASLKRITAKMPLAAQLDFCKRVRFPGGCNKCLSPN